MKIQNLLIFPLLFVQVLTFAQQTKSGCNYSGIQVSTQSQNSGNNISYNRTPEVRTTTPESYTPVSSTTYNVQSTKQVSNNNFTRTELQKFETTPVPCKNNHFHHSSTKPGPFADPYSYERKSGFLFSTNDYVNEICHTSVMHFYPGYYYDCNMKRHRMLFGYGVQVGLYTDLEKVKADVIRYTYAFKLPAYFFVDVSQYPYRYRLIIGRYSSLTPALKLRSYLWKYFPGCFVIRYNAGYRQCLSGACVVDRLAIPEDF
jgi:hypothetical protein